MRMLRFLIILIFVYALANLYVADSFYRTAGASSVWTFFGLLFAVSLLFPVLQRKEEVWSRALPGLRPILVLIRMMTLFAIGLFSLLFVFTVVRDILLFLSHFFLSDASYARASVWSLKFELGLTLAVLVIGVIQAVMGPKVKHVKIALKGLPKPFEGFRIIQVSDLHIGPTIRKAYVENVVRAVNEQKPDLIALTGDITDGSPTELGSIVAELSKMEATHGRYLVTGNHEYYWNALEWIEFHRNAGTQVLMNENRLIQKEGAQIAILGVPDVTAHHFVPDHRANPQQAASGLPEDTIKILLSHQPAIYQAAHQAGIHLQLSGHTHSGQYFPINLLIGFFQKYYRGLNRYESMWIYVNTGTGYWGPPLRAGVASEITVITLHNKDDL